MMRRIAVATVPAKVTAAQDYLRFAEVARCGGPAAMNSDLPLVHRDLTRKEQQVYDDALEVMHLYLSGECDFGPKHPLDTVEDDDKPPSRELAE